MKEKSVYDAIVIGSGITGGWAAKELTEKGLRVMERVLDRGLAEMSAGKPVWNSTAHTLSWRGEVVKRWKRHAPEQEAVLAALEAAGGPECIPDPLDAAARQAKQCLAKTRKRHPFPLADMQP